MTAYGPNRLEEEQSIVQEFQAARPDLAALHNVFASSRFATRLDKMPLRFAMSKHNPHDAFERDEFLHIFGIDVDHRTHPIKQWHIGTTVLTGFITDDELERQEVTAVVHDFAEAATKNGDVAFADKTEDDEKEESDMLQKVLRELYGGFCGNLLLQQVSPALDKTTGPGGLFNLCERVGYSHTQLRAWLYYEEFDGFLPWQQAAVCKSIATEFSAHKPHLEANRYFPYIDDFLIVNSAALRSMVALPTVEEIHG